jgi:uncharacterized membrane protein/mono/diheme cytochrome c family protein
MEIADFARFGRLHPLVLHFPIGLVFAVFVLEVMALRGRSMRLAQGPLLALAMLSAITTAACGWVLSHEDGYGGGELERHERLGIAVAVAVTVTALLFRRAERSPLATALYRMALATSFVLLLPAGHLGAKLTYGDDWLDGPRPRKQPSELASVDTAPRGEVAAVDEPAAKDGEAPAGSEAQVPPPDPEPPAPETYATVIEPIFAAYCTSCHGSGKHKADLRLHTREGILAGGESGAALVAGDPVASLLLTRAELPLEHEDHMPPEGKPQPSADELRALRAWITAGAPFDGHVELGVEITPPSRAPVETEKPAESSAVPPSAPAKGAALPSEPPSELLAALDAAFVHHERLAPDAPALWIDTAAIAPALDQAAFERWIVPLAPWIAELSLARAPLGDAALESLAHFPALVRLDLRATKITSAGLAHLAGHATLRELVLAQTALDDGVVATLASQPALTRVTLWKAGLTADALARLRAERPALTVRAGDESAAILEQEGELAFSSDRPLPGFEEIPPEQRPINAKCPVSDSPVNPKYTLTHEGRVIGFCCPNCPAQFTAEPVKFASKLP